MIEMCNRDNRSILFLGDFEEVGGGIEIRNKNSEPTISVRGCYSDDYDGGVIDIRNKDNISVVSIGTPNSKDGAILIQDKKGLKSKSYSSQ